MPPPKEPEGLLLAGPDNTKFYIPFEEMMKYTVSDEFYQQKHQQLVVKNQNAESCLDGCSDDCGCS